jgi:hypothetical protein
MQRLWFKPLGWFYFPVSLAGFVLSLLATLFCLTVFIAVDRQSHSVSDTLYGVFPFFASTFLLLDWLGVDLFPPRGLQALWPFDSGWYISGLDWFRQTRREQLFTWPVIEQNLLAIVQEMAILVPIAAALWLVRVKTLAGLASE